MLGTFDLQVYSWWTTFGKGTLYIPFPQLSNASDDEIETRFIRFCQIIGMEENQFMNFIKRRYVLLFWLSHNKYQASFFHTFASLEDYDEEVRLRIKTVANVLREPRKASWQETWTLVLPNSERARLLDKYRTLSKQRFSEESDFIILLKDESMQNCQPPLDKYSKSYENASFNVWLKKSLLT